MVVLGRWHWAFVAFRVADGATGVLFPLAAFLRYELSVAGVAGTVAVLNLGSVPAVLAWCKIMDRHPARRRIAITGLLVAAASFTVLAFPVPYWAYLGAALGAVVFGVATAPAAGILVLEGRPRREWAEATGRLSRRTGRAYLVGLGIVLVLGLAEGLTPWHIFAGAATIAVWAALLAAWYITPRAKLAVATPAPETMGMDAVPARVLERTIYFPGRLRNRLGLVRLRDAWRKPDEATQPPGKSVSRPILVGVFLMFLATSMFFSTYQGVLLNVVGLAAGMVILAETGSHVSNTLAFRWAGRMGTMHGEAEAIQAGLALRVFGLAALMGGILWGGEATIYLLIAAGVVLGISFSLVQVNVPCLLAGLHPGGHSNGIGAYHTILALGVLAGAASGFLLVLVLPISVLYAVSLGTAIIGAVVLGVSAHRAHAAPSPPDRA